MINKRYFVLKPYREWLVPFDIVKSIVKHTSRCFPADFQETLDLTWWKNIFIWEIIIAFALKNPTESGGSLWHRKKSVQLSSMLHGLVSLPTFKNSGLDLIKGRYLEVNMAFSKKNTYCLERAPQHEDNPKLVASVLFRFWETIKHLAQILSRNVNRLPLSPCGYRFSMRRLHICWKNGNAEEFLASLKIVTSGKQREPRVLTAML
jgi:hypothetical protein